MDKEVKIGKKRGRKKKEKKLKSIAIMTEMRSNRVRKINVINYDLDGNLIESKGEEVVSRFKFVGYCPNCSKMVVDNDIINNRYQCVCGNKCSVNKLSNESVILKDKEITKERNVNRIMILKDDDDICE